LPDLVFVQNDFMRLHWWAVCASLAPGLLRVKLEDIVLIAYITGRRVRPLENIITAHQHSIQLLLYFNPLSNQPTNQPTSPSK
jgi:hypothetical protein